MMRAYGLCLLIQLAAMAVTLGAFRAGTGDAWLAAGLYLLCSGFVFAYWIKLLSEIRVKDGISAEREKFLAERERIRLQAEQEKLDMVRDAQQQVSREAARASARANSRVAAIAAVAVAGGVALIAAQLFLLGMLTLSAAGGAMAGYVMRIRQERANAEKRLARESVVAVEAEWDDTLEDAPPALPGR